MDESLKQKLRINAATLHKMGSTWVMGAAGALGTLWLALPADQQAALVAHLPVPVWVGPIVLTAAGLLARAWPQHGITPAEAAAKSADAPQPPDTNKDAP